MTNGMPVDSPGTSVTAVDRLVTAGAAVDSPVTNVTVVDTLIS